MVLKAIRLDKAMMLVRVRAMSISSKFIAGNLTLILRVMIFLGGYNTVIDGGV